MTATGKSNYNVDDLEDNNSISMLAVLLRSAVLSVEQNTRDRCSCWYASK
jgi:hypothetical protein